MTRACPTCHIEQFYLTEADLGKARASACVSKLAELNRYVGVRNSGGIIIDPAHREVVNHAEVIWSGDQIFRGEHRVYGFVLFREAQILPRMNCMLATTKSSLLNLL